VVAPAGQGPVEVDVFGDFDRETVVARCRALSAPCRRASRAARALPRAPLSAANREPRAC
jgi:hypothetical protein